MKLTYVRPLAPLAMLSLMACHIPGMPSSAKAPTGQVVATVDGEEVTLSEVNAELAGAPRPPNAAIAKQMQESALQQVLVRKIMAKAAEDQGLTKTPAFAIQKLRANQALMAQALQQQLVAAVPAVSRQEADTFVAEHPGMFAQRKILTIEQIRMPRPKDIQDLKALEPLMTLGAVEALLNSRGVEFQRATSIIDSASADPNLIAQIEKLPSNEPFVVPAGDAVLINQVRDSRSAPFSGETAVQYAMSFLRNQKSQQTVSKSIENLVKTKAAGIKYNDAFKPAHPLGYTPPKPAAAPPAAAPAPAMAPAPAAAKP